MTPVDQAAELDRLLRELDSEREPRRRQESLSTLTSVVASTLDIREIFQRVSAIAREAIGARAGDIFRMILREGLMLSLTGGAIGLLGALWLGRAGSSLLFGVTANDPMTFATVTVLLTAVAVAACYFPARRAMRVDPIVALRAT